MGRHTTQLKKHYINAWQIPVPYGSKLHTPPTNYHLLAARQEPYKKAQLLIKNIWEFSGKRSGEWTISRKMTRQKEDKFHKDLSHTLLTLTVHNTMMFLIFQG